MPPAKANCETGLFRRHPDNPILTAKNWPYPVNTVFNAGAVRLETSGETLLLVRCEDHRGHSHLTAARSKDGASGWEVDPAPTFTRGAPNHSEELWGVEDPRITWVPELGRYAVIYVAYGRGGGIDVRWVVISGGPEFFRITKRLHHALHGAEGAA